MDIYDQKRHILEKGLRNVPFDGWSVATFKSAALELDEDPMIITALFPRGEADLMQFFATWADDKMLQALESIDIENLRIRDRIRIAVETRIGLLAPYKESVNLCFKKLLLPQNARMAASITWQTADVIWNWAGDTSTDYNRYTKRFLLSGVISTTMTYWMQDQSDGHIKTYEFLNRRIDNVLFVGKNVGSLIKNVAKLKPGFYSQIFKTN